MHGYSLAVQALPSHECENADAQRMAAAIAEIIERQGDCLPHDLVNEGFSYDEINRLWAKAKVLALFEAKISKR